MSKISIDLDLAVVQKALHAKVQPAVDKILEGYDLSAMIVRELEKPVETRQDSLAFTIMAHNRMLDTLTGRQRKEEPRIVALIQQAIHEAADTYVKDGLKKQTKQLEAAFKKMIEGSSNKLAKTFLASLEGAIEDDWSFELKATVSPKEPERDYDSCDD